MPAKPVWYGRLDHIIADLDSLPHPWVDRATLQQILGIGRRRAQQILQPCVTLQLGANSLADRRRLINYLRLLAGGKAAFYENRRRQKLAEAIDGWRTRRLEQPQLEVEAPVTVVRRRFHDLPSGVSISPGRITIDFSEPPEALEKLLALAMAIGNDLSGFESLAVAKS
jgi:hypothetical protein